MRPIDADEITATLEIAMSMMENTKSIIGVENLPVIDVEIKAYTDILKGIKEQPTVQPEQREGEWIPVHPLQSDDSGAYMCSKCKTGMWEIRPSSYHYCPNCGAKMKGAKHETD